MSSGRDSFIIIGILTVLPIAVASSTGQIKLTYEVCPRERVNCEPSSFSRTTFLNSQEVPTVVSLKKKNKILRAKCEGPSPLRWDIDIISGHSNVNIEKSEVFIYPHDEGSTYEIDIELKFTTKFFGGFLRCEEFNGQGSVEVYVTLGRYEFLYWQGVYLGYLSSRYTNADHFQVPCPFLPDGGQLEIWEGAKKELMYDRELSDNCVKCACTSSLAYASNKCSSPITRSQKQEFVKLDNNNDTFFTCLDAITGALQIKPTINDENVTDIQNCIDKSLKPMQPWEIVRSDQHVGFIIKGAPNPESVYVCKSKDIPGAQLSFVTLDSSKRVNASLQYWDTPGKPHGIVCKVRDSMYSNPALKMASCRDVSSCGLLIRSRVGFKRLESKGTALKGKSLKEVEPNSPNVFGQIIEASNSSELTDGIVVCQYLWVDGKFAQEIDFFFKGLDTKFYFVSNYPEEAVIQLQRYQVPKSISSEGSSSFGFKCIISTFVLFPKIQFTVAFSNGTSRTVSSGTKSPLFNISKVEPVGLSALQQFIFIHTTDLNMNVTCSAPKITSANWVNATKNAEEERQAESRGSSAEDSNSNTFEIVAMVAGGGFFMFVIISAVLYVKYIRAKRTIRDLTTDEVNEFIEGSGKNIQNRCSFNVDSAAFPNEYTIAPDLVKINENEVLGKGEHATCLRGEFNGIPVAIKMTKVTTEVEYFKSFLKEIKIIMAYIGVHENVVGFMGAVVEKIKQRHCQVVVELSPYGDLLKFLRDNSAVFDTSDVLPEVVLSCAQNGHRLTTIHLIGFCSQIAAGMEFLASKKIIHGDLAARNVLVFDNYKVKIADFGLSTKLYDTANYKKKQQVPLPYRWMALESLQYLEFSTHSDVWSYGITLWEIFTLGQVPFSTESWSVEFIQQVEQGLRPSQPPLASNEIYNFMHACWNNDPGSRPDFAQAKRFFQNVFNEDYCQL